MEKSNLIEKIKNDRPGTVYWCTLMGECRVIGTEFMGKPCIMVESTKPKPSNGCIELTPDGREYSKYEEAECLLWPSKEIRTWEGYGEDKGLSFADVFGFDPMAAVDDMIDSVKGGAKC